MRTWEPEEAPQVGFSRQGAPSKGRTPGRAGQDHPSKEKVLGTFTESSTSIPVVQTGQEPAAAREAPNASTRAMDDTDGGGEVSQRDTDDVESISDGEARETRHRSSPSDPSLREIQDHVLTGHASFRSWCGACVRGRGRAERHRGDGHKEDEDGSKIPVLSWD